MVTQFPIVAVEEVEKKRPTVKTNGPRPVVLLVGDQPAIAQPIAEILPHRGFTVMTVPDENTALEIAALIPPDLLIADATVPGIKWLAFALAMKQAVPKCHVLLLSEPVWPAELIESTWYAGHNIVTVA
jgi:CheY-like chemotaxis protein